MNSAGRRCSSRGMRDVADVGPSSRRCAVCEPVVSAREISKIAATPAPSSAAPRHWKTHLLGRLRRQVALTADTGLSRLLNELRAYPCDQQVNQAASASG